VPSVPAFFGFRNRDEALATFRQAVDLRNNLAHGHDLVEGISCPKAIELTEKIEKLLHCYETRRAEFERRFGAANHKT
jgi:hypothetical protein